MLSERRFDARLAALEAVARLAKGTEDRAILLENAEQLEEWLLRDGPEEPVRKWYTTNPMDEVRSYTDLIEWGRYGRGG